jgi:1,2-phenylacetyl-CoA epoxidase catalytic subunit
MAAPEGRAMLQARVDELLPEMLCWFGPRGEPGVEGLKREGLLAIDNEQMRQAYLGKIAPLLHEVGIRLPIRRDEATQTWEYEELPWNTWNNLQRRMQA